MSPYVLWMMKAYTPHALNYFLIPLNFNCLIVSFLGFLLLIMSSIKTDYLLFFASTTVVTSPGQTSHLKETLPFPSARCIPLLKSYVPAPIILKQTPNQRNITGCARSAHLKDLLYYIGSTYIHVLFF